MEENSAGTIAKFEHDTLEINHIIRQELRARERTQKTPAGIGVISDEARYRSSGIKGGLPEKKSCARLASSTFATAMSIIEKIESEQLKKDVPQFQVGDTVRVHTRVIEGDKERIQVYSGIVIGRKGTGLNANFTVRRVSYGEGVERVFPVNSPRIAKIEIERKGEVRRAKLNYLRKRKGKSATAVKEKSQEKPA
jgi:large subunit ribosomal protein L19